MSAFILKHGKTDSVLSDATLVEEESHLIDDLLEKAPHKAVKIPRTPLPKLQLTILCLLFGRLGEPVCFFVVFPFIPQMVRDFGVAKTDEEAGYYAGLVESLFALTQSLVVLRWGRWSDRVGRKPVLLFGLAGLAISMLTFGISTSFAGILLARAIGGFFSANASVTQSILGELTDSTNQATAYGIMPLMGGIGSSLGPLFGGYFADPAKHFPSLFDTPFHRAHPYFLACALSSLIPLVGMVLCHFCLEETVSRAKDREEYAMVATSPTDKADMESQQVMTQPSSIRELVTPAFRNVLISHSLIALVSTSCLALFPLFGFTPIQSGGLGMSTSSIGSILAVRGCATIAIQLFFFAPMQRRYGSVGYLRRAVVSFVIVFLLYPLLQPLAKTGYTTVTICATSFVMIFWALANTSWSTSAIIVCSHAPSRQDLGTLNGLMETCTSAVRAISPSFSSYIFALSVDQHWLGGRFWWLTMLAIAISEVAAAWAVKEGNFSWRNQASLAGEEDEDDSETVVGSPRQSVAAQNEGEHSHQA